MPLKSINGLAYFKLAHTPRNSTKWCIKNVYIFKITYFRIKTWNKCLPFTTSKHTTQTLPKNVAALEHRHNHSFLIRNWVFIISWRQQNQRWWLVEYDEEGYTGLLVHVIFIRSCDVSEKTAKRSLTAKKVKWWRPSDIKRRAIFFGAQRGFQTNGGLPAVLKWSFVKVLGIVRNYNDGPNKFRASLPMRL